jgi:hypothetical protein
MARMGLPMSGAIGGVAVSGCRVNPDVMAARMRERFGRRPFNARERAVYVAWGT